MSNEMTTMPTKAMAEIVAEWITPAMNELKGKDGRDRMIGRLRDMIRDNDDRRREVIESAEDGVLLCHQALEAEFNWAVENYKEIPATLRAYMLRKKFPKRKPGRQADMWDHRERNITFAILVSAACIQFGLDVDHNPANDRPCAVEVVAAALKLKGIKVSPKRLAAVVTDELKWAKDPQGILAPSSMT
jgi:hypothetical protein